MEQQRSDEWFKKRTGRITGSRVGAILGLNPWQTREDVLRAMVRECHRAPSEFEGNIATNYGQSHEEEAILDFTLETGLDVVETGFHTYEDWAGASPDGLIGDDAILEVKCPYGKRNGGEFETAQEQEHYGSQMQWEMLCTGRAKAYFWQWSPHGHKLEIIDRDDDWLNEHIPVLRQFHAFYLSELDNTEHLEPLRKEINTDRARMLIEEYDQLKDAQDLAKERQKEVLDELIAIGGGGNALIWGRKLTKVQKEGSVSYAKAIKALCPDADLETYRGKPSSFWKLS